MTDPGSRFDLHIVLIEPEIPQNTGSIGRLCLATGTTLHLVHPLGFDISDRAVRRAGLDYWEHVKVVEHESAEAFMASMPEDAPLMFLDEKAAHSLYEHEFKPGTYMIYGKETLGLPEWMLTRYSHLTVSIPMFDARVRSLNLSNSAAIVLYEGIRQLSF